jgi:hypothetical protein
MNNIGPAFITVIGGIIGLAIVAVLVGQKAQTSNVLQAGGTMLSGIIGAAVAPVSGGSNQFGSTGTSIGGAAH